MTCKDCVYFDVCSALNPELKKNPKDYIGSDLCAKQCTTFKDRSRLVELPQSVHLCDAVHFVLKGTYSECYAFIAEFKRICSLRMHIANREFGGLRDVGVQFDLLDTLEYRENAIAYVLRNPLAAIHSLESHRNFFFSRIKYRNIPIR